MTDNLKLAREARARAFHVVEGNGDISPWPSVKEDVPALCDAIEAQAAEIERQRKLIESAAAAMRAGLHDKVAEQAAEIERLKAFADQQEKSLDAWDQKLRHSINIRMRLREAVIKFNESLKGKKGAILGGESFAALEKLRDELENPHDD